MMLSYIELIENISKNFTNREKKKIASFINRLHFINLDISSRKSKDNYDNIVNLFDYLVIMKRIYIELKYF